MQSTCLTTFCFSQNIGSLVGLFGGLILPSDDDHPALKTTGNWRIIFCLPLPMYIIMALIFFTVVNYDTPKFLLARGKSDQCNSAVKKIYKTNGD